MVLLKQLPHHPPRELALGAAALTAIMGITIWCVRDYQDYMSLGPGGPPHNVVGWAMMAIAKPIALSKAGALQVTDYPNEGAHKEISDLPNRVGARASVGGIAPHRQRSELPPEHMKQHITNLFNSAVAHNSHLIESRLSLYERHNPAVFVRQNILTTTASETARIARGEIGHIHGEYSMHLYLSPADARQVILKGWGEKHRLSKPKTSLIQFEWFHLAATYLMIYGPRNEKELEHVRMILCCSIRFMTGREDVQVPQSEILVDSN